MNKAIFRDIQNWLFLGLLLITSISIWVPFSPLMPTEGLDPSWAYATNQALFQGLSFGSDFIFPSGPYSSIYTRAFHPSTDGLMLWGSLYLSLSFCLASLFVFNESSILLRLLLLITVSALCFLHDSLLIFYPLLVGGSVLKLATNPKQWSMNKLQEGVFFVILFSCLGLLPLIKGTMLITCIITIFFSSLLLVLKKDRRGCFLVCTIPFVSLIFFWCLSGQPFGDLLSYFKSMSSIINGYGEAMSISQREFDVVLYVIASLILVLFFAAQNSIPLVERIIFCMMLLSTLFMVFKAGFVRHDGHAMIAGTGILLIAFLVVALSKNKRMILVLSVVFFVGLGVDSKYTQISPKTIMQNFFFTYTGAWEGLLSRVVQKDKLINDYKKSLFDLRTKLNFPLLNGSTDIYSWGQSYLIASGNHWNPRPAFQSYAAYTPDLIKKNIQHLLGDKSPDNLIVKIETIDGRLPSLDDGASWPIIFSKYQPTMFQNDFLFLKKTSRINNLDEKIILKKKYILGDRVYLKDVHAPVFVKINVSLNIFGKLISTLYKPTQLQIIINLQDDASRSYRIISGMTKTGFLLSPLVESTNDFCLLYASNKSLDNRRVKSFVIKTRHAKFMWNKEYTVELIKLNVPIYQNALGLCKRIV